MREALSWLFARPALPRKWWQVIVWWELRRIPYNVIVGIAGVISLVLFYVFITASGGLKPGEDAVEPLALVLAPILVNVAYTAGWVFEIALILLDRRDVGVGPALYKLGLAFSLCAVAVPSVFWGVIWLARAVWPGRPAG